MEANAAQAQKPNPLELKRSVTTDFTDFTDKKAPKTFAEANARNAEERASAEK
jgi:hypothetical protein